MAETGQAGFVGHAPSIAIKKSERAKYEELWNEPEYRGVAPGEHYVERFLHVSQAQPGDTVIDYGCGTGRPSVLLNTAKLDVTMIDIASNCLDEWVVRLTEKYPEHLRFVRHDLTKWPIPAKRAKFGFSADLLEHVPPDELDKVLWSIVRGARYVFLAISTQPDSLGGLHGEPLHLSLHDFEWWKAKLESMRFGIAWSEDAGSSVFFYGTAYASSKDLQQVMVLNIEEDTIKQNILANLRLGLQEIVPHETQPDAEVILLAGGPSLNDFKDEIYARAKAGMPVVTMNGTYNWARQHGILPAATVVLDGRPFNRRFLRPVTPGCKYLMCSQVDPSLLEAIPREQTWLWHSGSAVMVREALDEFSKETGETRNWWPVYGGSTVLLRSLVLLRMLGFAKIHLYGADSCLAETGEHHAYEQPENDMVQSAEVEVGGRQFSCHPWMWSQAQEFIDLTKAMGDQLEIEVYGPGLLAWIIQTASELPVPPDAVPKIYNIIDTEEQGNGNECISTVQQGQEESAVRGP